MKKRVVIVSALISLCLLTIVFVSIHSWYNSSFKDPVAFYQKNKSLLNESKDILLKEFKSSGLEGNSEKDKSGYIKLEHSILIEKNSEDKLVVVKDDKENLVDNVFSEECRSMIEELFDNGVEDISKWCGDDSLSFSLGSDMNNVMINIVFEKGYEGDYKIDENWHFSKASKWL